MRRLGEIASRPIPPERSLAVFAVIAVILLVSAAVLMAIPGPNTGELAPDSIEIQAAPPAQPDRDRQLENAVESSARRFMGAYLPFLHGKNGPDEIKAASPELIERLGRQVRISPAARGREARVTNVHAGLIRAGRATVTVTVETGGITYPVILHLRLTASHWLVYRVGAE